jgi:hypothetical protein
MNTNTKSQESYERIN